MKVIVYHVDVIVLYYNGINKSNTNHINTNRSHVGSTIIDQGTQDEFLFRGHDIRSMNSRDANDEENVVMEDDINHLNSFKNKATTNTNTETINEL